MQFLLWLRKLSQPLPLTTTSDLCCLGGSAASVMASHRLWSGMSLRGTSGRSSTRICRPTSPLLTVTLLPFRTRQEWRLIRGTRKGRTGERWRLRRMLRLLPKILWTSGLHRFVSVALYHIYLLLSFKESSKNYHTDLPQYAQDICACPPTSVPAERMFSLSGCLSNDRFAAIKPENLENRVLVKANKFV